MCEIAFPEIERRFVSLSLKLIKFPVSCLLSVGTEMLEGQGSFRGRSSDFSLRLHVNIDPRVHLNLVQEHFLEMFRCSNLAPSRSNSVFVIRVPIYVR